MGDWFDIGGSALGAVGSIGGGLLGAGKSSDGFSKKGAGQQLAFEYGAAPTRAKTLLRFAKAAGLHPLAVIGSGAQSQPVIQGQSGDNSSIGYGVSKALNNIGQDISGSKMRNQNESARALELLTKAQELDNSVTYGQLLTEQLRKERNPPAPDPEPLGNVQIVPDRQIAEDPNVPGKTAGNHPGTTVHHDQYGYRHETPSQSLKDVSEENPAAMGRIVAIEAGRLAKYRVMATTPKGRNAIRRERDKLKPPKGYHYRLNEFLGQWRLVPNSRGKALFDTWNPLKRFTPYGKEKPFTGDLF